MKLEQHPLWPTLVKWMEDSPPPLVPFAPKHEFQKNVDAAVLADPIWGHDDAKNGYWQTYQEARALGKALVGNRYNINFHAVLYRISEHALGRALCRASSIAAIFPQTVDDFSLSTQHPGFVPALEAWASRFMQKTFDGKATLPWVIRDLIRTDKCAADFWLTACQKEIGDTAAYAKILASEVDRARAAARMKARRKATPKHSAFKDWIELLWVPAALWCRDDSQIVSFLAPGLTENMTEAYGRVRRDISDLGFSSSRRKSF